MQKPPHILVVDDMESDRGFVAAALQASGYAVTCVGSGEEALQSINDHIFDAAILDVIMPKLDGIETARKIRKNPKNESLPLLFVSALRGGPSQKFYNEFNAELVSHIEKPISINLIQESIAKLFMQQTAYNTTHAHTKSFIGCKSGLFARAFAKSCREYNIEPTLLETEASILSGLMDTQPDLIFLEDELLTGENEDLIKTIKNTPGLAESYLVIGSSLEQKSLNSSETFESDFYLPIPFLKNQVEAIFRQVLNLSKKVLLLCDEKGEFENLNNELIREGFTVEWSHSLEDAEQAIYDFFPDIIYAKSTIGETSITDLCQSVKNQLIYSHMMFIIETSSQAQKNMTTLLESGADDIILKRRGIRNKVRLIRSRVSTPGKGRKKHLLLIDNNLLERGNVSRLLRRNSYNVTVTDSLDGIETIINEEFLDGIVLSYPMAKEDNWNFCIEIVSEKGLYDLPIMMMTPSSEIPNIKKLQNLLSLAGIIPVPFTNSEFLGVVREVLEDVQNKRTRTELEKYVPSDGVKHVGDLLSGAKETSVERKFITVLFSDIASFTTKCEEEDPETVVSLLNNYFDRMTEIILKNSGIIDKFIGDAILVRFDSGLTEVDALNAVRTSYEMLKSLHLYNKEAEHPLNIRIGINSGEVVLGTIGGSRSLRNYTMIGDAVNVAQRLQSEAPLQGCYVSAETRQLLNDSIKLGELVYTPVKGKKQPVAMCELVTPFKLL